jgi:hypothetical protein
LHWFEYGDVRVGHQARPCGATAIGVSRAGTREERSRALLQGLRRHGAIVVALASLAIVEDRQSACGGLLTVPGAGGSARVASARDVRAGQLRAARRRVGRQAAAEQAPRVEVVQQRREGADVTRGRRRSGLPEWPEIEAPGGLPAERLGHCALALDEVSVGLERCDLDAASEVDAEGDERFETGDPAAGDGHVVEARRPRCTRHP